MASSLKNLNVLFVDDDRLTVEITRRLLEKYFKKVYFTYDGDEALELYEKEKENIDVIISDYNMPHMQGDELAKQVLKIDENQTFFLYSSENIEDEAKEVGLEFLPKPFELEYFDYIASVHQEKSVLSA